MNRIRDVIESIFTIDADIFLSIVVISPVVASLFGEFNAWFIIMLLTMVFDFTLGIFRALVGKSDKTEDGQLESHSCAKGIFKKGSFLFFVVICNELDIAMNMDYIRTGFIIAVSINEIVSINENCNALGWNIPFIDTIVGIMKEALSSLVKE